MSANSHTQLASTAAWPLRETLAEKVSAEKTNSMAIFMPAWRDLINIALILAAVVGVVLLVSPSRNFPITDDWCYAQSVDALLKGNFRPHEYSMATGLGHIGWGAFVQLALGTGFTALALANIAMGAACLVLFYLLLRHLAIPSAWAMLGVAALGISPMFIYLSYSFMTDITFVTYSLAALLCYVRAAQFAQSKLKQQSSPLRIETWLLAGSAFAALAFLTRQLGLFLPVVAVAYFWWSNSGLSWRRIFAIGALPALSAFGFTLWQKSYPATFAAYYESTARASTFGHPLEFVLSRSTSIVVSLFLIGYMLLPFIRLNRKVIWFPLLLLVVLLGFERPSFVNDGSLLPDAVGTTMTHVGLPMPDFIGGVQVLPEWFWTAADVLSLAIVSVFAYQGILYFLRWFNNTRTQLRNSNNTSPTSDPITENNDKSKQRESLITRLKWLISNRPGMDAAWIVYGFGITIIVVTATLSYALFDRYWLPALPAVLLLAIRYSARHTNGAPGIGRWLVLVPLVAFAIISEQDYMTTAQARWDAAQNLVRQGVSKNQIYMGFEWAGWYLADEGVDYFRRTGNTGTTLNPAYAVTDPVYLITGSPYEKYQQVESVPYQSWLRGWGEILVLKRESR